jgi:hypothetical protein
MAEANRSTTSPPTATLAFSVDEFCSAHRISRATYYNLQREGRAPASMKVGRRTLIAVESAEAWRRQMEQAGA